MKKSLAFLLGLLLIVSLVPAGMTMALLGDVNTDAAVTAADAAAILRYIVRLGTLTPQQLADADANEDGKVTAADAAAILRYIVKLDTLPPSGPTVTLAPTPTGATPSPTPKPAPAVPTGEDGMTAQGKITARTLNLRKGPGTQYDIIEPLSKDAVIYLFVRYNNWFYVQVKTSGNRGWISDSPSYVELTMERLSHYGTVSTTYLTAPLRLTASSESTQLATVLGGTRVGIVGQTGDWYKVRLLSSAATVGYMLRSYFTASATVSVDADASAYLPGATPGPGDPTPMPGNSSPDFSTANGKVNASTLYLRSTPATVGANTSASVHNIIDTLVRNQEVFVFEKTTTGGDTWYRVQTKTSTPITGYCSASYITLSNTRLAAFAELNPVPAPLRSSGSHAANLLTTLSTRNELVGILSQTSDNNWYKIRLYSNGQEGYILKDHVSFLYNVDNLPVLPTPPPVKPVPNGVLADAATSSSNSPLYSAATSSSTLIATAGKDVGLYIFEAAGTGSWHQVQVLTGSHAGKTGYMRNSVVRLVNEVIQNFATTSKSVTIRMGAGQNFPALVHGGTDLTLSAGTTVGVLSVTPGYCKIRVLNLGWDGFVAADALTGLGMPTFTATPIPDGLTATAYITQSTVNLRSDPSLLNPPIAGLLKNVKLDVYEKAGDWYHVTVRSGDASGLSGYILSTLSTLNHDRIVQFGSVSTSFATLRGTGSAAGELLMLLSNGQRVGILAETGDWYKVRVLATGAEGYVAKSALAGLSTADTAMGAPVDASTELITM